MKKIKITESELVSIIKKVINSEELLREQINTNNYRQKIPQDNTYVNRKKIVLAPELNHIQYPELKTCHTEAKKEVLVAQDYWKKWLDDPNTKQRWRNVWCAGRFKNDNVCKNQNNIFSDYSKYLNSDLKIATYGGRSKSPKPITIAWVMSDQQDKVYVNCDLYMKKNQNERVETMIHEVQHTLSFIHQMSPQAMLDDTFRNYKLNLQTDNRSWYKKMRDYFFGAEKPKVEKVGLHRSYVDAEKLKSSKANLNRQFGNVSDYISSIWESSLDWYFDTHKDDLHYACKWTEKLSNIQAIRRNLGLKSGEDITRKHLEPYIYRSKRNTDVFWYLMCWVLNGYPDLDSWLATTNSFVRNSTNKGIGSNVS